MKSNHKPGAHLVYIPLIAHTNKLVGEFESTLLNSFIGNSRLRQWISRPDVPEAVRACAKLFDRLFGPTHYTRGDEEEDMEEADVADIAPSSYEVHSSVLLC